MKMRRRSIDVALLAVLAGGTGALSGCDSVKAALAELAKANATGPRKLSDEDAFKYLAKDRAAAPKTDTNSVNEIIDAEVAKSSGQKQSMKSAKPGVVKLLKSVSHARRTIQTEKFKQDVSFVKKAAFKADCNNEIDLEDADIKSEFLIPQIDKIPVRDQKYRGTCAAFTGIGAIEYSAVNPEKGDNGGNPNLETLDLSEQRFYWQSKPECQGSGKCPLPGSGEGSWYGAGFDESVASAATNIPYEQNCAYEPMPGSTDTQTPQPASCESGAVGVTKVESWCGVRQLIDFLHQGYAIPYASPLTGNWENNDGLITAKDLAPGESGHAGGHAFLIVGYKKLPAGLPAAEGGICFVIKNSWGTGWGAGGFSCMTLGWMERVGFEGFLDYPQPIPTGVLLADELQMSVPVLPPDEGTPEDATIDDFEGDEELPVDGDEPELEPLPPDLDPNGDITPIDDGTGEDTGEDTGAGGNDTGAGGSGAGGNDTGAGGSDTGGGTDIPGMDVPEPPMDKFTAGRLLGPNRAYYKILTAKEGNELRIKGLIKGGGETKQVRIILTGNKLVYKGDVVGEFTDGVATLCTEEFTSLCSLRYRKSQKLMYIQFRDEDLRTVKTTEVAADQGSWSDVSLGGESYGVFVPADPINIDFLLNPKTFVRLGGGDASRLSLRQKKASSGLGFDLALSGMQVGEIPFDNITATSLCSGAYASTCGLVGSDKVDVIPSNLRKLKK